MNDAPAIPSPTGPGIPTTMPKEEIERLFYQVAGPDGEIDWQELKRLLDQIMKDGKRRSPLSVNVSGSHSTGIPNRHVSNLLLMNRVCEASVCESRGEPAVCFE